MKQPVNKDSKDKTEFKQLPIIRKKNQLYSNNLGNIIKNLANPRFLGSIHMKKEASRYNTIENLIDDELKLKMTKGIKNTMFNPVTKILILLALVFNLIWFILIAIF
ncbi:MAG: hypothetical protein JSV62_10515 [Promethearchaeota archaeon]|nr:MAG: hypothetical protein JSV62_10515 [Candidatus Lokiarchaeota archaeon]